MKFFCGLLMVVMLLCLVPVGAAQDGGRAVITPDSASQLVELIRLGRGSTEYVAYSPDGQTIAVASAVGVWLYPAAALNTETEPPLLKTVKLVEAMAFAPDGKTLVTASNRELQYWDAATQELLGTANTGKSAYGLAFSPDGALLAVNIGYGGLLLWDMAANVEKVTISGNLQTNGGVIFSPDGAHVAGSTSDYKVHLWNTADGSEAVVFEGHSRYVYDLAFSPDGAVLASAGYDKSVRLWDVSAGVELAALAGTEENPLDEAYSVAFSPDGRLLASGHAKGKIALWDAAGKTLKLVTGPAAGEIRDVAFSPDGKYLASASSENIAHIWDTATGAEVMATVGHTFLMNAAVFSPDSGTLALAEWSKQLWLWDVAGLQELNFATPLPKASAASLSNESLLAFASDGSVLATTDGFDIVLLNPADGVEILRLDDCRGTMVGFVFSPDNSLIAEATSDGLCVYSVAAGALLVSFTSADWLEGVVFSPDQTLIATTSKDHTARVYGLP
jgi:WD40 repeat protein